MAEAVKHLWDLSENEAAQEYLQAEERRRMDREAEMEYKWEKGMEKGMEKVALNMLRAGFSLHDISTCTELSLDKLEELKKSQDK